MTIDTILTAQYLEGRRHGWDNVNEDEVCDVNVNFIQMNSNGETAAKETKMSIYEHV